MGTETYRIEERHRDADFILTDLGDRSYETVKLTPDTRYGASTPLARTAAGAVVPAGAGLIAVPATQTFAGFLVAEVEAGAPGERVLGANLCRDAEVVSDRIDFPVGADAAETADLFDAIAEAAAARGIIFRAR